jgi:hypothetical protein
MQPRGTGCHFLNSRRSVSGALTGSIGSALENICDVNFVAAQTHRLDDLGKQLSRLANERLALRILIGAGRFAHEHQVGSFIAYSKNDLLPRGNQVRALHAGQCLLVQFGERTGGGHCDRSRGDFHRLIGYWTSRLQKSVELSRIHHYSPLPSRLFTLKVVYCGAQQLMVGVHLLENKTRPSTRTENLS